MSKKRKKIDGTIMKKSVRTPEKIVTAVVVALVVAAIGVTVFKVEYDSRAVRKPVAEVNTEKLTESTAPDYGYDFTFEPHNSTEVYSGDLILVNNQTKLQDSTLNDSNNNNNNNIVSLYDEAIAQGEDENNMSFAVTDLNVKMRKNAADHFIEMMDGFYKATGINDVLACSGYRSNEEQQQIYDEDLAATGLDYSERVAKPGYSEHESGYSLDLDINEEGREYDGTGDYNWINENCAKYGYILRYPKDKTAITDIEYESWHYRYVGIPHSTYIMGHNICLEEYLQQLRTNNAYTDSGLTTLDIQDGNDNWHVYYYGVDMSQSTVYVPVPTGKDFTISGNNTDGFVIAFKSDK